MFNVKNLYIICSMFCCCSAVITLHAQTPYYSLKLSVNDTSANNFNYNITAYDVSFQYTPVVPSGDYWFGNDTSVLNWNALPDSLINSSSVKKLSSAPGKSFEYGNQQMVWENIITFIITRQRADTKNNEPAITDTMIIVMPVLLKSFVTFIDPGTVPFKKGYYEILSGFIYESSNWLKITLPANLVWQNTDFEARKIRLDPRSFPK